MSVRKRILVCPLDWGLGHATRCIPVVRELIAQDTEVIIAAEGRPLKLLQQEFPQLKTIVFKGYEIEYPSGSGMVAKMALSAPRILKRIASEGKELEKILKEHQIDAVISDNRYGLGTSTVPSVFIIHQLMVKSPLGEGLLNKITKNYISKYNQCWVPDYEGENSLSGDLAHKFPLPDNVKFVGPLSRFQPVTSGGELKKKYRLLALISGPEPQRTAFEEMIIEQLQDLEGKFAIVAGRPGEIAPLNLPEGETLRYYSHLGTDDLRELLLSAEVVLSRPGYSTIMDLAALGKKAIFVPTPGQTEQEYLGELYFKRGQHFLMRQKDLDIKKSLAEVEKYQGFGTLKHTDLLAGAVSDFLKAMP